MKRVVSNIIVALIYAFFTAKSTVARTFCIAGNGSDSDSGMMTVCTKLSLALLSGFWLAAYYAAPLSLLSPVVWAAGGGACPSGANYWNAAGTTQVTLSSLGITSCYYVAANGSDSNNGLSEISPFLHMPGMKSFTGAATISAGTGIIVRGGDVWHFGNPGATPYAGAMAGWSLSADSGDSSNPIYVGVDPAWFSGSSFARPQLNGDNAVFNGTAFPSSCTYDYAPSSVNSPVHLGSFTILDDFELTGVCWSGNLSSNSGMITPGSNDILERLWVHGYTMTSSASDLFGLTIGASNLVYDRDIFDGSDAPHWAAGASECTNGGSPCDTGIAIYARCSVVRNSVFHYVRVAGVCSDTQLVHDNTFEFQAGAPTGNFEGKQHDDAIMYFNGNASSSGVFMTFYNNVVRHNWIDEQFYTGVSAGSTEYIFNNVFYDNHDATPGNAFNLNAQSSGTQTLYVVNNTFDNDTDASSGLTNGTVISLYGNTSNCGNSFGIGWNGPVNAANNHLIGYANLAALFTTRCGTVTYTLNDDGGNVIETTATARSQGYLQSTTPVGDLATGAGGATVGAGVNETSLCSSFSSDNALCSTTTGAASTNNGAITFPTLNALARPATGSWDSGAYLFPSNSQPPAGANGLSSLVR